MTGIVTCPECGRGYIPSTWMEDEEGRCIHCIDAVADAASSAVDQRRADAVADNERMARLLAAMPSAEVADRTAPVYDRYGRITNYRVTAAHGHPDLAVDGTTFHAVGRWDEDFRRTVYHWEVVA